MGRKDGGDADVENGRLDVEEEKRCLDDCEEVKQEDDSSSIGKKPSGDSEGSGSQSIKARKPNAVTGILLKGVNVTTEFFSENRDLLTHAFIGVLVAGYIGYFIAAMVSGFRDPMPLVILTSVVLGIILWEFFSPKVVSWITNNCGNLTKILKKKAWKKITFWIQLLCGLGFMLWVIVSILLQNPLQLVPLLGLGLIILLCFIFSKFPDDISWRPVVWGIALQFILGLLVLRTQFGFNAVKFIGDQVAAFMSYSDAGAKFVFGDDYTMHLFAFKILPMIVFFSTVTNMLYYVGLMQWFIGKLSWGMQKTVGTSAIESTVSVANIFVGMTEAPLVVRPYLNDLTKAEIHSVLTCGLGSIAFSVYGAFVEFGVDSVHLLTACVMSAPAGLAISRLLYPERKKSKFTTIDSLKLSEGTDRNIVEAAAVGASMSIGLVANIAANLIAFLALLAFINSTLGWFGSFIGYPDITFNELCGYLFMPLAFLMGADWEDCGIVGELFGIKTFLNEFIGYQTMKPYIANRLAGDVPKYDNGTLSFMSKKSEVVAIHALCGFCNVSALGIILGGVGSLMPERKRDLAELALRAFFGGILTCCMTACIASLLFVEKAANEFGASTAVMNYSTTAPILFNVTGTIVSFSGLGVNATGP